MANSAFDHSPSITVPGSSTNTALVRWSSTGADTFLDSTLVLSTSATPTLGIAADPDLLTFGNGTIAITGAITGVTTITATTFSGTLSGNATGSAATLTNARTIGGVSFNGSANINLPGVNAVGSQNTTGSAATLTTARTIGGVSFNGSAAIVPATITVADTTDTTSFVGLWESATGDLAPKTDAALTYNAGTGALSATTFHGSGANLTNLPAAGATLSGSTNNTIVTVTGADAMIGEANLIFTGTNLGIGVSDPDEFLEIKGGSNAFININHTDITAGGYQSGIRFKASDVNCYRIDVSGGDPNGSGDMSFRQGAAETVRLLLKGNGQVMINDDSSAGDGSNVPMLTVKLDAANSGEMAAFKWASHSQPVTSYAEADTMFSIRQAGNYAQLGFWGDSGATGGQILAVATTPTTTKSSSTMGAFRIMCSTNNGAATAALGHHNSENNNNMVTMDDNTSTRFLFGANGIAHADDSWADFSDGRLKFNQAVVPYGLAEVMQLQPKIYDKDSGYIVEEEFTDAEGNVVAVGEIVLEGRLRTNIGFVAQEVKAIIPEIVQDVNDFSWYSLNDGKLMAVVVKAIQELKAEIDALKE